MAVFVSLAVIGALLSTVILICRNPYSFEEVRDHDKLDHPNVWPKE